MLVYNTGNPYCGEEAGNDTDAEGHGETADRTCSDIVEDDGGDDGGKVRVEDGAESIIITVGKSLLHLFACTQAFLGTFIDKHIGVDGHTERKHKTGDTGHRKSRLERGKDTECEEEVEQQCTVGHHTGDETIVEHHKEHQEDEGYHAADETGLNGSGTEARTYGLFLYDGGGSGHLTALQHVGKVLGILCREVSADLALTTGNFALDGRCAVYKAVEDDGYRTLQVLLRNHGPVACTVGIHGHRNHRTMILVVVVLGVFNDVAGKCGSTVGTTEGIEFEHIAALEHVAGLHTPCEHEVGGEHFAGCGAADEFTHGSSIGTVDVTYHTTGGAYETLTAHTLHQTAEEGMCSMGCSNGLFVGFCRCGFLSTLIGGLGHLLEVVGDAGSRSGILSHCNLFLGRSLGGSGVGLFRMGSLGQTGIESREGGVDFIEGIALPELQVCTSLKQVTDTLGLLDTGHFNHNLSHLSATLKDLDVGLCHTEAVDTVLHHLVGVAHSSLDFGLKCTAHLGIAAVGGDVGFLELEGEYATELVLACLFLILADKDVEEVLAALFRFGFSLFDCSLDHGVAGIRTGKILYYFGHADLEDDVHTTLQVKSETDLQLFTLLVRVAEVHFFLTQGVEEGLSCHLVHCRSLRLVMTGHPAETQIEETDEAKKQCNDFDKYFVLHLVELGFYVIIFVCF